MIVSVFAANGPENALYNRLESILNFCIQTTQTNEIIIQIELNQIIWLAPLHHVVNKIITRIWFQLLFTM